MNNPDASEEELRVKQWAPYEKEYCIPTRDALQAIITHLDNNNLDRYIGSTQIMIAPSFKFRIIRGMITNFHQPQSTLLLLVSAFVDGKWKEMYDHALDNGYRFLSYGDSSLLLR